LGAVSGLLSHQNLLLRLLLLNKNPCFSFQNELTDSAAELSLQCRNHLRG
jgi:hypothetical protein